MPSMRASRWPRPLLAAFLAVAIVLVPAFPAAAAHGPVAAAPPESMELYVAPHGSGTGCVPEWPCSLETARERVRRLNHADMPFDVVVYVGGGTYELDEPFVLGAEDSGMNGHTITWRAAPGETPVLSGGVPVEGWTLTDAERGLWTAPAPDGVTVRQLFVDGRRAVRARGAGCEPEVCDATAAGLTGAAETGVASWRRPEDVEAVAHVRWRNYHCGVERVDDDVMVMEQPCWQNSSAGTGRTGPAWDTTTVDSSRYEGVAFFENAIELLDEPGEFVYDSAAETVTYRPRPGEDLNAASVMTPAYERLLRIEGTPENPVHDLRVDGLTFAYSAYHQPNTAEGYAGTQAGLTLTGWTGPEDHAGRYYTKPASAVLLRSGRRVTVSNSTFAHLGGAGIIAEHGTKDSTITSSTFTDLSSGAIYVGDTEPNPPDELTSLGNTVSYNTIRHIGQEYTDAVGIWGGYEVELTVDHNTLEHLPYSGISVGWGWNQPVARDPVMRDNEITGNRVIDVLMPEAGMHDGGAIYTQGPQPGTVISGNYINRSEYPPPERDGNGVYLDEQSSYILVERNVITRVGYKWVSNWAGYGIENVARNNWTDTTAPALSGRGSQMVDNDENLLWLPPEAIAVARAAGANPPGEVEQLPQVALSVDVEGDPFEPGETGTVSATVTNAAPDLPIDTVELALDVPAEWNAEPQGETTLHDVPGGQTATVSWLVTPSLPEGQVLANQPLAVEATWSSADGEGSRRVGTQVYVYGADNLAPEGEATQSSTYVLQSSGTPFPADNAIDDNLSNFAHTAAGDAQPWWQVDLGASQPIGKVAVWNRADCCQDRVSNYYVFVSDEPFTSDDPEATAAAEGVWSVFHEARAGRPTIVDVGRTGRYVRVQLVGDAMLNIAEVQVFAGQSPPA